MTIKTHETTAISVETSLEIVRNAVAVGRELEVAATVWVVGPSLEKIAFASADGATPHSRVTSLKKAQTASSTRKATGWMSDDLAIVLPMASDGLLTNVPGGFPITSTQGQICGAIGVAGGTVEQDAEIALAALKAVGIMQ